MKSITKTVTVLGGDQRFLFAAGHLNSLNHTVFLSGFDISETQTGLTPVKDMAQALNADVVILPLPVTKDGQTLFAPLTRTPVRLQTISENLSPKTLVFGGNIPAFFTGALAQKGINAVDYFKDEALTRKNAGLTARGIADILQTHLSSPATSLHIAVTGFGRVGEATALRLKGAGARVTVFARSQAGRDKAVSNGCDALPMTALNEKPFSFDALINTVPCPVIGENELCRINKDCFLLEVASAPYGIDRATAEALGFSYMNAPGIPGKVAPREAGIYIAETVDRLIKEVNVCPH